MVGSTVLVSRAFSYKVHEGLSANQNKCAVITVNAVLMLITTHLMMINCFWFCLLIESNGNLLTLDFDKISLEII